MNRRRLLQGLAAGGTATLSGCTGKTNGALTAEVTEGSRFLQGVRVFRTTVFGKPVSTKLELELDQEAVGVVGGIAFLVNGEVAKRVHLTAGTYILDVSLIPSDISGEVKDFDGERVGIAFIEVWSV